MAKMLAFTDPHGDMASATKILRLAKRERPDLVVCSGDISFFCMKYGPFLDEMRRLGRDVHFIPGNHESQEETKRIWLRFPFMKDVTFRTVEASGVLIGGVPGNDSAYWPGPADDAGTLAMAESLWGERDRTKRFLFLCHYPPSGTNVDGRNHPTPDSGGSRAARAIVDRLEPDLVVCGHYHQDFGKMDKIGRTMVVNPGPNGMIMGLDAARLETRRLSE